MNTKKWIQTPTPDRTIINELSSSLKVSLPIATLLTQRNIATFEEANTFFNPKLENLHDPFLMKNMDAAVDRLTKAIQEKQKIMVFGDYDVDGTTAVTLMYAFLKKEGADLCYYIPDRYKEGYGLSTQGIDEALTHGVKLLITLDCGIKSIDKIAYARQKGLDVIVCDHHEPGSEIPNAIVLDPKQKDCKYPFKELTGCGVGFKLLYAYLQKQNKSTKKLESYLDLVALSIGADIVPVIGENRILASEGLKIINEKPRHSFQQLLELANRKFPVTLTDLVFVIAPRINAAGRLRSGRFAVELMLSKDPKIIESLAKDIHQDNEERKGIDKEMTLEALEMIANDVDFSRKKSTVVYAENWHKGVVGIVASRLIEHHYRPTIVLTLSNGKITGSARTIAQFNLYDALNQCDDLLEQWGGHYHAAGLTLLPENLDAFQARFDEVVQSNFKEVEVLEEQFFDKEISFSELYGPTENRMKIPRIYRILERFEPFGPGNMKPVFLIRNVFTKNYTILKEAHLKITMFQPSKDVLMEGIGFNLAHLQDEITYGVPYELLCTLEKNVWKDRETLQLNIKDVRAMV
jgi:single-stranded-DNA-specific exonuclease